MRRRLPALLVSAVMLVLVVAPVQARGPQSRHEQTIAFWTPARMAAAVPRDFTYHPNLGFLPAAKPPGSPGGPGGGGGGGGGGSTTGASWTADGAIQDRTGKVYFNMGGSYYICSGTATTDTRANYSLVLTAAHCAYDESNGAFATEWMFIPDFDAQPTYRCADTLHGCWTADALVVHDGYASAGGFNTQATLHDFAFAVVGPGGHDDTQLDADLRTFDLDIPGFTDVGQTAYAFGYPAAQKYKGNDLVYCAGAVFEDPYNNEDTWGLPCGMTGGSSGGPWLSGFDASNQTGALSSLNSYGYSGVKAMHGPKFNDDTAAVYQAANQATNTDVVVP